MAKADMSKIDKVEMTKNDKADTTKIDKAETAKIDKADTARIDLDAMSIEELATLRDNANAKLLEKVTARQVELEAEIERLAQYGKQSKKAVANAPAAKPRKALGTASDVTDSTGADTPVPAAA
jgi:hypothetical protein